MSIDHTVSMPVGERRAAAHVSATPAREPQAALRLWLSLVAACVALMVLIGGATRLTESGLSITQWEPLFGAVPPLTAAAWDAKFEAYRQIPQYALHPDMTLSEFRTIFYWEWTHRLVGRALGLLIAVPLAVFWLSGRLPPGLKPRLLALLGLVALQGAVGWWMVKSGLVERTEVSQYRLATHLLLATATFGFVIWMAQDLTPSPASTDVAPARLRRWASLLVLLVFAQIGLGALVAGARAGMIYNTWPLMGGRLVPPASELLARQPLWTNVFENLTTVQFQHRTVAYVLLLAAVLHVLHARWAVPGTAIAQRAVILAGLVACQAVIGIATLVLVLPLGLALAHQAFAMAVFAMAVVHRRRLDQAGDVATAARA